MQPNPSNEAKISSWAHLNTAVSALMELVNDLYAFCERHAMAPHTAMARHGTPVDQVPVETRAVLGEAIETLVLMLSPFTPHLCEELWERLGHAGGLVTVAWPTFDAEVARADEIVVPVQVNGKLRSKVKVPADAEEQSIQQAASRGCSAEDLELGSLEGPDRGCPVSLSQEGEGGPEAGSQPR